MEEAPLPTLQSDALILIFHKLPIRSLLQSMLVCKEWCSLISDPFFKSNYDPTSIPNHPLHLMMIPKPHNRARAKSALRYETSVEESDNHHLVSCHQPLPGNNKENPSFTIMGSWNGLVAVHNHHGDVTLLNPCTGEEKTVHIGLNQDERWHGHLCGLSYDSSSREYKAILMVFVWSHIPTVDLYVVSFKHGEWKVTDLSVDHMDSWPNDNTGITVNGAPHWIVSQPQQQLWFFDHCEEEFWEMPTLKEWQGKRLCGPGALGGKLTVAVSNNDCNSRCLGGFEVWVLRDSANPESWSRMFVIVNQLRYVSPLMSMNDEEVLVDLHQEELMVYNHRSHTIRRLQPKMKRKLYEIIIYHPTFISPTATCLSNPIN